MTVAETKLYRQTSCKKYTGRKKEKDRERKKERKKERRNGGYREMAPSGLDMNNVEI